MTLLSGCIPRMCEPASVYGADVHPATLLTASNIAAGCALVLLVCVVVLVITFWRDERPAWKRVTPIVIAAAGLASALTALSARLTYARYLKPDLSPDASPPDWYAQIGQAAMDGLSQEIQLYGTIAFALVLLTLVLVFAWGVLLQARAVSQRPPTHSSVTYKPLRWELHSWPFP